MSLESKNTHITDPAVEVARQRLEDAEGAYNAATASVNELSGKINAMRSEHDELVNHRVATGSTNVDASIYALHAGIESLKVKLAEAQSQASNLAPGINTARVELQTVQAQAARKDNLTKAQELAERCRELDAQLCAALADCAAHGARAQTSLAVLVKPSINLVRWLQTGAIPLNTSH